MTSSPVAPSTTCRCGNRKDLTASFCRWCYPLLTDDLRRRLYRRSGYEEAYEEAVAFLDEALAEKKRVNDEKIRRLTAR